MIFSSKKDIWMSTLIWVLTIAFLWIFYRSIFVQLDIIGIFIMLILICLLLAIWFNTRYKIEKDKLTISYGLIKIAINIQDIHSIRKTTNPFVAPSLSVHRIEINYGKYKTIQISPRELNRFTDELKKKNPNIRFD